MTGEQLKRQIKKRGVTMKDVAERLGVSSNNFSNQLRDGKDVKSTTVEAVADILGVTAAELYGEAPAPLTAPASPRLAHGTDRQLLRDAALMAMQALLISGSKFDEQTLRGASYEQHVARLSIRQAYAMLDEFKRRGIDR